MRSSHSLISNTCHSACSHTIDRTNETTPPELHCLARATSKVQFFLSRDITLYSAIELAQQPLLGRHCYRHRWLSLRLPLLVQPPQLS